MGMVAYGWSAARGNHTLVSAIEPIKSSLESQGIPLHFTWCPAHCDIKENEQADALAGTAANRRRAEVIVLRPRSVFASDIRQERAKASERQRTVLWNSRDDNHERLSRLLVTPIPEWFRAHGE